MNRSIAGALLAVIALLFLADRADAGPELVFRGDNVTVRFTLAPCAYPAIAMALLANDAKEPIRSASVHFSGNEVPACWGALGEDKVLVVDALGNGGFIERKHLKAEPGV